MALAYAFRIYIAQAFPNSRKGKEPLQALAGGPLRGEIALVLARLQAKGTQQFPPKPRPDGSPSGLPTGSATVTRLVEVSDAIIHLTIAVGETGSHAFATRPNKPPKKLKKWSPEMEHHVTFVFPRSPEPRFFVVAQAIRRRDPVRRLISMMRAESLVLRTEREAEVKRQREEARARGEVLRKAEPPYKLSLELQQASDESYLDDILAGAESAQVVFKSSRMDGRGRSSSVERVLQVKLRDKNILDVGRVLARQWTARWRAGNAATPHEGVSEAADLLAERSLMDEDEGGRYDSAYVTVLSKSRQSTTIAVDTLRDAFTYPVSNAEPDIFQHYEAVSARLAKVASQEGLDVDEIDPEEMDRCLRG